MSLLIAPKVHLRNTDLEKECPLRVCVRTRPIRSPRAPCTGGGLCQRPEALPYCSGGEQDTWGRAEEAGHRGPSPWGLSLGALPRPRTNPGRRHAMAA